MNRRRTLRRLYRDTVPAMLDCCWTGHVSRAFSVALFLLYGTACLRAESIDALRAALKAAVDRSSVESAGAPPFRLEARFETFDYKGEPQGAGTLTEEFLRPGVHKLTVHEGSSGEVYAPEDQAKIGDPAPASSGSFMQRLLVEMLLHPGPAQSDMDSALLKEKDQKLGDITLRCITVQLTGKTPRGAVRFPQMYCLSQNQPLLRIAVSRYNLQVSYNKLVDFAGHTIAEDLTLRQGTRLRGRLQVTKLSSAPALKDNEFPPEPMDRVDADRLATGTKVGPDVISGRLLNKVAPVYPMVAKERHITGAVVLHAVIGKDGQSRIWRSCPVRWSSPNRPWMRSVNGGISPTCWMVSQPKSIQR